MDLTGNRDKSRMRAILGRERGLDEVARSIKFDVRRLRPDSIGALLVTCCDESEHECQVAFQKNFVHFMLPKLKYASEAPMRIANLGARYEIGAARILENHYATPESREGFKVIAIKVNSHVSKDGDGRYGEMQRYEQPSYYCGALRHLLDGVRGAHTEALGDAFVSEGLDRVALIREKVEPNYQALAAAIVNARLQARAALIETQEFEPCTPTLYLVLACVTLNTPEKDDELLCGYYWSDRRDGEKSEYIGLSDDPSGYEFEHDTHGALTVRDDKIDTVRPARDHRKMIEEAWEAEAPSIPKKLAEAHQKTTDIDAVKPLLKVAVAGLAQAAGVPVGLFLFAEGLVGLHHLWRVHRMAAGKGTAGDIEAILNEFEHTLESMPAERAKEVLDKLLERR